MRKYLQIASDRLSWIAEGDGPTVVLLHGFGEDGSIWEQQLHCLKNYYKVLVPDLRGSGHSANCTAPESIEQMAQDLALILDAENIQNCSILGHSMGGYIALAFAELFPDRVHALGLIHSTAFADSPEKKQIRNKAIEFIENNGSAAFFKTAIPNLFHPLFQQQHPEMIEQLLQQSSILRDEVVIAYYRAMIHRPDRTDVLRHSKFPVLIFIGSSDKAVHPDDALQQATLPAICQVELLEGVAHMGMWEAVNQLNQSLLFFLKMTYDR
ncbi:MAG: alpha/beta fold hydrolase [Lacibacter sp.]